MNHGAVVRDRFKANTPDRLSTVSWNHNPVITIMKKSISKLFALMAVLGLALGNFTLGAMAQQAPAPAPAPEAPKNEAPAEEEKPKPPVKDGEKPGDEEKSE